MPGHRKPSRSLFAALPGDLKRSIRSQHDAPSDQAAEALVYVLADAADGLLPTQPRGSPPARKRRKIKEHAWDCIGLVPRYSQSQDVPKELQKYWAQRHLLFPRYDDLPLLLDHTGWFSVTPHAIALHIADRCKCDVIVDAFCGVGGNAIEFARTCERVIAVDNDLTRLRLARHNALHHGVANRIEFILADFTDFARSIEGSELIDVVFLSPPWGGIEYISSPEYTLSSILPIPGGDLFDLSSRLTPNIAFFLPRNVSVQEVSLLAPLTLDGREWVEVEEEWVGDKLKAVTAYFGSLVA